MTKEQKTKRDLEEMDKLFAEMGIDVPKEEKKESQESKKSKKKKKKEKKEKIAENADNAEESKGEQPAVETKQEQPAAEAEQTQPEEQKQAPVEQSQSEAPVDREAAVREALNKRFKGHNKKQHADDAAVLAKKEALVRLIAVAHINRSSLN
jgi:hypothetical protein